MKHDTDWLSVALIVFTVIGMALVALAKWASSSEGYVKELEDHGTPFTRRWVACDRRLIDPHGAAAVSPWSRPISRRRLTTPIDRRCSRHGRLATTADGDLPSSRG